MPDPEISKLFQLDPSIHFLNHGSFGACPNPVFAVYQEWQRRLESQPVLFLGRKYRDFEHEARSVLANFLHTRVENLVFVPNATHGVNIVAHSIPLNPGDQILATNHEYGACEYAWEDVCRSTGAEYLSQPITMPIVSEDQIVEAIWQGVTNRTKVIFVSHISSPTAVRFPVERICQMAREAGILSLVDGAHAPGQISVDLEKIGADWYTGNCHKWMFSPKGSAFLYARPEVQALVKPRIISWGYHASETTTSGSSFLDNLLWTGTTDPSAYLAVPAGIEFLQNFLSIELKTRCHQILKMAIDRICKTVNMDSCYPLDGDMFYQMGIAPLPVHIDADIVKRELYDEFQVEVPIISWNDQKFVRISVQLYNSQDDVDALVEGLREILNR